MSLPQQRGGYAIYKHQTFYVHEGNNLSIPGEGNGYEGLASQPYGDQVGIGFQSYRLFLTLISH